MQNSDLASKVKPFPILHQLNLLQCTFQCVTLKSMSLRLSFLNCFAWIISCLLYLFFSISLFFLNWITLHTHFSFLFQINFAPVTHTKLFAIFLKNIIKWILLSLFWNKSGSKNMKRGAWRRTQVKGQILQREGGPFHNKNKLIWSSMHRKRE